jgi:hypothetical protein
MSETERQWIKELQQKINKPINTYISIEDFKTFFKHRKEKTASSTSGCHMGHYKILAEKADNTCHPIVELIIINIAIITARPLQRWKHSAQVMIEKGKGRYIENLRIIQLCEADLNFTLNIIWGNRLIRNAMHNKALDLAQYARLGMTCNSAVWNKVLFCDLLRQTLTPGIMTEYDATAAFDRVLHALTIITCHQLGLPQHACLFMYHLLHNMEFHLITGFGKSISSFTNNEDKTQVGQGVLQGSSSTAPIYTVNTDLCLAAYQKIATGSSFKHPITGDLIQDVTTQYVDDKTDLLNEQHSQVPTDPRSRASIRDSLFDNATKNLNNWAQLLWMSGGNLNSNKCFYYYLQPNYNFQTQQITYETSRKAPGHITLTDPATNNEHPLTGLEPKEARRTLGVLLAPDGNTSQQYELTRDKAHLFTNKLRYSRAKKHTKWIALTSVLEPAFLHPLMACQMTTKQMMHIDKILMNAKCHALGLNEHFP